MIFNKIKRIIRQRLLTSEEAAEDNKVRVQIAKEAPELIARHLLRFEPLQTQAELRREARRSGRLRIVRYCPRAKQVVVETIGA